MRIGSLRHTDASYYSELPLFWTDGPIKVLGLLCTADPKEMTRLNFDSIMSKVNNVVECWSKRSLALLDKISIVNTLIVPLFTYRLFVMCSPSKNQFAQFKTIVRSFLWGDKKPQIAYNKLIRSYDQGGLRLLDLQKHDLALKVKWVQVARLKPDAFGFMFLVQTYQWELRSL